jgi:hypothetical protein
LIPEISVNPFSFAKGSAPGTGLNNLGASVNAGGVEELPGAEVEDPDG